MSLLTGGVHSATARAASAITAASLGHRELDALVRQRPDIGVVIFRNLASGLGEKLSRADAAIHPDGKN
jgi:CRP-like cAMP-binding protein